MIKITKEQLKELYVKGVCYTEDTIKVVDDDNDWNLATNILYDGYGEITLENNSEDENLKIIQK
jgi:hypothetical protein